MVLDSLIIFFVIPLSPLLLSTLLLLPGAFAGVEEGDYIHTRVEGLSFEEVISRPEMAFDYLRKYFFARMGQSQEVIDYFDHQRTHVLPQVSLPLEEGQGVSLAMVGDIMWIRENWGNYYSPKVKDLLHSFDAVLGNLETPIAPSQDIPGSFWPDVVTFNSYPILLRELDREGRNPFTALGIANNHSFDRGEDGLVETMEQLDAMGIGHSGARESLVDSPVHIFERKSIHFGFYATTYGVNQTDYRPESVHLNAMEGIIAPVAIDKVVFDGAEAAIQEMERQGVDVKIISIHWGNEFELYPDPSLLPLGRKLIEMGFDVVMGNHPHVIQPSEICFVNTASNDGKGCHLKTSDGRSRKGIIYYSLGNFTTAMFTTFTQIGVVQQLTFLRRGDRVDWFNPHHQLVVNPLPSEVVGFQKNTGSILEEELEEVVCSVPREDWWEDEREHIGRNCERFRLHLKYLRNHLEGREDVELSQRVKNA